MSGEELLDTPQKLKDFWLFAIEQGWKSYEMREHVALLVEEADWKSPVVQQFFDGPDPEYSSSIWIVHHLFRTFKSMSPTPHPETQTDEEYLDEQWREIGEQVDYFKAETYEALLEQAPPNQREASSRSN